MTIYIPKAIADRLFLDGGEAVVDGRAITFDDISRCDECGKYFITDTADEMHLLDSGDVWTYCSDECWDVQLRHMTRGELKSAAKRNPEVRDWLDAQERAREPEYD